MTTETMSVHKALCEMKIIGDRIEIAIGNIVPCAYKKHSSSKINGLTVDEFIKNNKSAYQKASDLIARADAIKRAISLSNARTTVVVAGKTMTVAEAIYEMQYGVNAKRELLSHIRDNYNRVMNSIRLENESKLDTRLDQYIKDNFGSKDKADPKALEEARRVFVENNTVDLIDAIGALEEIKRLDDEINEFVVAVDSALQTSNATTMITIEY